MAAVEPPECRCPGCTQVTRPTGPVTVTCERPLHAQGPKAGAPYPPTWLTTLPRIRRGLSGPPTHAAGAQSRCPTNPAGGLFRSWVAGAPRRVNSRDSFAFRLPGPAPHQGRGLFCNGIARAQNALGHGCPWLWRRGLETPPPPPPLLLFSSPPGAKENRITHAHIDLRRWIQMLDRKSHTVGLAQLYPARVVTCCEVVEDRVLRR